MNKTKHLYRTMQRRPATLSWLFGLCCAMSVQAAPRVDRLTDDQVSVRELMQLDTRQALTLARARFSELNPAMPEEPGRIARSMSAEPRLSAIYGVGRHLMAEVLLDQTLFLYRRGQALPVGVAPGDNVYMLKSITTSCVELQKPDALHHLCLRPRQWAGQ